MVINNALLTCWVDFAIYLTNFIAQPPTFQVPNRGLRNMRYVHFILECIMRISPRKENAYKLAILVIHWQTALSARQRIIGQVRKNLSVSTI